MTAALDLRARRERLRRTVAGQRLDGALVYSWRRGAVAWLTGYAPGFMTNTATLWLPAEGDPLLQVRFGHEIPRAAQTSGLQVVAGDAPAQLVSEDAGRIGLVGGDFAIDELPVGVERALEARDVATVRLDDLLDDWRAVKEPADVARLVSATEICDGALRALPSRLAGLSDYEIAAVVEGEARRSGAMRALCLVGVGRAACITEPHGTRVRDGDPVGLELTLQADGACAHACHTVAGSDRDRRAARVCAAARAAVVDALRPGVAVDGVVAAGDAVLADAGLLEAKEYDFGHGVGVDTPERPRLVAGTDAVVAAGMVIAVHVAVRRADATWTQGGPVVISPEGASELAPGAVWARPYGVG